MRFPFISRERYEEVKAERDKKIVELEAENKRFSAIIHAHGLGYALLESKDYPSATEETPDQPEEPLANLKGINPAHTARKISAYLQERFNKGERAPAEILIQRAIREGQAQAELKHSNLAKQHDQPTSN